MKYFVWTVIGIVTLVTIVAVIVVGSPNEERMRRFDKQRVADLQTLQNRMVDYWQAKGALPEYQEMLVDELRGVQVPVDPETGDQYDYEWLGAYRFQLCAVFNTSNLQEDTSEYDRPTMVPKGPFFGEQSWKHDKGEVCFEREIDPDFFKTKENIPGEVMMAPPLPEPER